MNRYSLLGIVMMLLCPVGMRAEQVDYRSLQRYDSLFTSALEAHDLPSCSKFLPLLLTDCDTTFNVEYTAGIWALTMPVAKYYGMEVSCTRDARQCDSLATQVAAQYLCDLVRLSQGDYQQAFRQYAQAVPCLRVQPDSVYAVLLQMEREYTSGTQSSAFLARLDTTRLLPDSLTLRAKIKESKKRVVSNDPLSYTTIYYRVRSGDTLGHIAMRYHVRVSQLKQWNGLRGDFIREGQRLKIRKYNN